MADERDSREIRIEPTDEGRKGGEAYTAATPAPVTRTHTRTLDWSAAIWAGIISGAIFLVLEMLMVPLFAGGSAWGPPRMIAAMVLGRDVLPPPATFDFGVLMAAMVVHFLMSVVYAVILAAIVHRFETGTAVLIGAFFGLALYVINFYMFTAVFPWFAAARNWITIFTHIVFGAAAAWAYKALAKPAVRTTYT